MTSSGVSFPAASSGFLVPAAFDFGGAALDIAAALAALTRSAAAVGLTAVVEFAARVLVAEVVLLSVVLGLGAELPRDLLAEAAAAGVCLKAEVEALFANLDDVRVFLVSSPAVAAVLAGAGLDEAEASLDVDVVVGLGRLLDAELALDVCLDMLAADAEDEALDRVEEVGRFGGSLAASLVSGFVLTASVRGTAGFLVAELSGLLGIGLRSGGLVAADLGVVLVVPDATEEPVDPPDFVDLASSPGFVLLPAVAEVGLVAVVFVADVVDLAPAVGLVVVVVDLAVAGALVVAVGFVVVFDATTAGSFLRGTDLETEDLGIGFPEFAFDAVVGLLVADFLGVAFGSSFLTASSACSLVTLGVSSPFLGEGAGDLSLTGVAGVMATSGMESAARALVTGATLSSVMSTEVSGSSMGENCANISPPF